MVPYGPPEIRLPMKPLHPKISFILINIVVYERQLLLFLQLEITNKMFTLYLYFIIAS